MILTEIANKLTKIKTHSFKQIIKELMEYKNNPNFFDLFSSTVVEQKLENSGLRYEKNSGLGYIENSGLDYDEFLKKFPYVLHENGGVLVGVCGCALVPENENNQLVSTHNKSKILPVSAQLNQQIKGEYSGIIQFLPFLINGSVVRSLLKQKVASNNIEFVNLPYNENSINKILIDINNENKYRFSIDFNQSSFVHQ